LCPISATKDELLAQKSAIQLKPACAANSRPVQFSRKRLNRLKPAWTLAKAGHQLKPAYTPAKAGLDWHSQNFSSFAGLFSFGDLVL
jgi:hypothetical protein